MTVFKRGAETWDAVRALRDRLLTASDWTQMPDAPGSPETRAAFAAYRQALRDITTTFATPAAVVWPAKPGE